MNMTADDDGIRRLSVVRVQPPKPKSPGAEAAARYRARRRGQNEPKRNPGPKPATTTTLRQEISDLKATVQRHELARRLHAEQMRRHFGTLTVESVARDLLAVLARDDPRRDTTERQELLGDVLAAIESRHEQWPR